MLASCCGLDFGTSNSTIGIVKNQIPQLVTLDNQRPIIRSAIFCDSLQKSWVFGQDGITQYLEGSPGRLLMSLKSVLGSPLMNDETLIFNEFVSYSQILERFIQHLKTSAEKAAQTELTHVVLGRPVRFHDTDNNQDQLAQQTLENIAYRSGFREISFQYEPIAAAMNYETTITREQLALIIDMGGGTSDFTIIRLQPNQIKLDRKEDVLANGGIHIAGTDFDQRLSIKSIMPLLGMNSLMRSTNYDIALPTNDYYDLTTWHTLNQLYDAKTLMRIQQLQLASYDKHLLDRFIKVLKTKSGHELLNVVETAKQKLSAEENTVINLDFIERTLASHVQRKDFNLAISEQIDKIIEKINATINDAGIGHQDINAIFYTGGSTKIPFIQEKINALFPLAEIVKGDAFGSVGMGLTLEAFRQIR